jgi:hypothetical protein
VLPLSLSYLIAPKANSARGSRGSKLTA